MECELKVGVGATEIAVGDGIATQGAPAIGVVIAVESKGVVESTAAGAVQSLPSAHGVESGKAVGTVPSCVQEGAALR